MSATRATLGAISRSTSSNLPVMEDSKRVKPVMLPPGRAQLATVPSLTGSVDPTKTMGMVVPVSARNHNTVRPP
jgi:hypothetical protein